MLANTVDQGDCRSSGTLCSWVVKYNAPRWDPSLAAILAALTAVSLERD